MMILGFPITIVPIIEEIIDIKILLFWHDISDSFE